MRSLSWGNDVHPIWLISTMYWTCAPSTLHGCTLWKWFLATLAIYQWSPSEHLCLIQSVFVSLKGLKSLLGSIMFTDLPYEVIALKLGRWPINSRYRVHLRFQRYGYRLRIVPCTHSNKASSTSRLKEFIINCFNSRSLDLNGMWCSSSQKKTLRFILIQIDIHLSMCAS
jgi:hypothetical protein